MKLIKLKVGAMDNNCYILVSDEGNGMLIDPGADAKKILSALDENGAMLRYILLTHGHFDHIGALREVAQHTRAGVVVSKEDAELLRDPVKNVGARFGFSNNRYDLSDITPECLVSDGDEITLDEITVQVISTPGHTKGSVVYKLDEMLFTGDTLFAGTIGIVTHYGGSLAEEVASVKRLAALEGDYTVFPGHGEETTLETERRTNPYLGQASYDDCF